MPQAWFALSATIHIALVLCEIGTAACMQKCLSSHVVGVCTSPAQHRSADARDACRVQVTISQIDKTLDAGDACRTQVSVIQMDTTLSWTDMQVSEQERSQRLHQAAP